MQGTTPGSRKNADQNIMDGQHIPVDWIHIGHNSRAHRRQNQMETTRSRCGQESERGRLKARQSKVRLFELITSHHEETGRYRGTGTVVTVQSHKGWCAI